MNHPNKHIASIVFILAAMCVNLSAQVAGEVPVAGTLQSPNILLRIYENYHDTITFLDMDSDGEMDLKISLYKGYPPHDAPNIVMFETLENKLAICVDSVGSFNAVHYDLNDTLCTGNNSWGIESLYAAGCYGGWNCTLDTSSLNNKYIAYRNNITGDVGWLKVSMKLYAETEETFVEFQISEMIVFNLGTGLESPSGHFNFVMSPNPSASNYLSVSSSTSIAMVELYDLSGRRIASYKSGFDRIDLPEGSGVFIVKAYDKEGRSSTEKLIKL